MKTKAAKKLKARKKADRKALKKWMKKNKVGVYQNKKTAAAAAPSAPAGAVPGVGGWVNDAVPDSSTLLAYKLLKDSVGAGNSAVFQDMLENELKYLLAGISVLKNDSKISQAMGGETMSNAATLAQVIKNKTKEIDYNDRIEEVASHILYHDYSKPGKFGLAPNRIRPSFLDRTADGVKLHYRVAGASGYPVLVNSTDPLGGFAVGAPNAVAPPAIAARPLVGAPGGAANAAAIYGRPPAIFGW